MRFKGPVEWAFRHLTPSVSLRSFIREGREILFVIAVAATGSCVQDASLRQPRGPLIILDVPGYKVNLSFNGGKVVIYGSELM